MRSYRSLAVLQAGLAALNRRDKIVAHFEARGAAKGEAAVLY